MEMDTTNDRNTGVMAYLPGLALICILVALMLQNYAALAWHDLAWVVLFVLSGLIRMPFSQRNKSNVITVDKKTLQESVLLSAMFLTMALLPVLYLATKGTFLDVMAFANYNLPAGLSFVGVLLIPAFSYLFWRSHYDLGRNWSVTLEMCEDHSLVTNGVYKHVRHPMYSAIWIAAIAQPLLIQNLIAGGLVILAFGAMCVLRIPREEEMMEANFGAQYRNYMARTCRILPKIL